MVPTGIIKKMHGQAVFTDEVLKTVEKEADQVHG
jgi:trigger factor